MARGLDGLAEGGTNYLVTTLSYSNSQRLILIPILATMVTVHGSLPLHPFQITYGISYPKKEPGNLGLVVAKGLGSETPFDCTIAGRPCVLY